MSIFDKTALKNFIFEASQATYASGDDSIKKKQPDGSTTIEYESGAYKYHDNYFGGEPYGGREVVFLNDKPLWMMVYYGLVHEGANKEVYGFLMESLSNTTVDMPYRGPVLFEKGELKYENNLVGDVDNFSGTERIFRNEQCIYEASYIGGLVDQ
ncbi:MAG: DUF5680 domain-containing protein [Patescibacteria group bacterium]